MRKLWQQIAPAIAALVLASLISACATPQARLEEPSAIQPAPALVAVTAFAGRERLYIDYQEGDTLVFSSSAWPVQPTVEDSYQVQKTVLPIVTIDEVAIETLADRPTSAKPVTILSPEQWVKFQYAFLRSIAPNDPQMGNVVEFDGEEYFFHCDAAGDFHSVRIQNKPVDLRIANTFDIEHSIDLARALLPAYLHSNDFDGRRFLFNTGEEGATSLHFVYVDLDSDVTAFVRSSATELETVGGAGTGQTVGQVVRSQSVGLLSRPLSSVHRLLFLLTNTGVDALRSTPTPRGSDIELPPLHQGEGMDLQAWETKLDQLTGTPASRGTIGFMVDGGEYFPRLIDAMLAETQSISMRTYVFDNDDYSLKIADILKQRSNEGVNVQLLLDGLGTIIATNSDPDSLPIGYEAPPSVRRYIKDGSKVNLRQATNPWMTGDHTKTTIIGDNTAFIGGMNIGREYRYEWHDLMMEVSGSVVDVLRKDFEDTWTHAGVFGDLGYALKRLTPYRERAEKVQAGFPIRVLHTKAGDSEIFRTQLAAIRQARRYIYIQNAYFSDDAILSELVAARRRGVDVRVIIPMRGNHGPLNKSNSVAANVMIENGIRVFIYPGMSHVKAAVYDGWACLGSANFDKLSFRVNKETNLATSHSETVELLLERVFLPDMKRSPELTEPFPESFSDHLAELVSDFLL